MPNTYQSLQLLSSTEDPAMWSHPVLDLYAIPDHPLPKQRARLYLTPSTFGEDLEPDRLSCDDQGLCRGRRQGDADRLE